MIEPHTDECTGCEIAEHGRRAFLRDLAISAAAVAAALGIVPRSADAAPFRFIGALAVRGPERSYAIPSSDGVQIDKAEEVIIARAGGAVYAFALACPHQNTALRWDGGQNRFQCPKHKSKYRPDGTFIEGRATRGLDRFAVRKDGNSIVVDLDRLFREDRDKAAWAGAVVTV